ncbi:MAG: MFS transporter, partial [Proteobacteria bacterium]|nr:MFS transporter [Pseudomonadota bacterium]MDA0951568.1 MFS transporter [Pseudomonadota bacterium]
MNETPSTLDRWLAAGSVYTQPRVIAVLLLGFSSGLPLALTGATLQAWMTDSGVDLTLIGIFALVGLPYSIKFVWAPLVDRVRLPVLARRLGHRRAWLLATQGLLALAVV